MSRSIDWLACPKNPQKWMSLWPNLRNMKHKSTVSNNIFHMVVITKILYGIICYILKAESILSAWLNYCLLFSSIYKLWLSLQIEVLSLASLLDYTPSCHRRRESSWLLLWELHTSRNLTVSYTVLWFSKSRRFHAYIIHQHSLCLNWI
jgi:hypothetical protein